VSSGILYETPAFGVSVRRPVTDPMRVLVRGLSFANLSEGRIGGPAQTPAARVSVACIRDKYGGVHHGQGKCRSSRHTI
jgi:hypothetical protein